MLVKSDDPIFKSLEIILTKQSGQCNVNEDNINTIDEFINQFDTDYLYIFGHSNRIRMV